MCSDVRKWNDLFVFAFRPVLLKADKRTANEFSVALGLRSPLQLINQPKKVAGENQLEAMTSALVVWWYGYELSILASSMQCPSPFLSTILGSYLRVETKVSLPAFVLVHY